MFCRKHDGAESSIRGHEAGLAFWRGREHDWSPESLAFS
jgi:hypothetical protein